MPEIKHSIILILLLFSIDIAHSQENRTEVSIDFRINSTSIDTAYSDNAARMQEIKDLLQKLSHRDVTTSITNVSFCGAASPEGSYQLNRKLARGRILSLERLVRKELDIPDSIITRNDSYIPWDYLRNGVEQSDMAYKDEVIRILNEEGKLVDYIHPDTHVDNRIVKLKELDGGKVWMQMNSMFFKEMRNACAIFVTYKTVVHRIDSVAAPRIAAYHMKEPGIRIAYNIPDPTAEVPEAEGWVRKAYIKTNAAAAALAIVNLAGEIDIAKHWSFNLPVYYSAWDYFRSTIKFRTFAIQPEFRYWLSEDNDGFFTGVHFGMAYYNFAFDGDYRYQDHNRETPAVGGGISLGYCLPISRNKRWQMEFALGAGTYPLHYDVFHNTSRTKDGLMIESLKKRYWGLDQAGISFSYSFDLKKNGGRR